MSDFVTRYFRSVDERDADTFVSMFAEDASFRYGNQDPETGRDAIVGAVEQFWAAVPGISHRIVEEWNAGDTDIAELEVTYTRSDGRELTLPSTTIIRRDGDRIRDLRVYQDVAPLFA